MLYLNKDVELFMIRFARLCLRLDESASHYIFAKTSIKIDTDRAYYFKWINKQEKCVLAFVQLQTTWFIKIYFVMKIMTWTFH